MGYRSPNAHQESHSHYCGHVFLAIGSAPIITHKKSTMYLYGIGRVMVAALLVGLEIEFAQMIIAEIHERAFNTSTSYPFPFLIF